MSETRSVTTFNIHPQLRAKLVKAGYANLRDLGETTPVELSKELGISNEEALSLLQITKPAVIHAISAADSLDLERKRMPISTSSQALDQLFGGGGIPVCKITEFCGEPGIGKTQLGIQLCVNVQIPAHQPDTENEAIYIDTEGSFIPQRAAEIAHKACEKINENRQMHVDNAMTVETILSNIHYFRVHDHVELVALVKILDDFLKSHKKIRVIVIDSIAFHFRLNFPDMALRTRLLNGISQTLMQLAKDFELAVILMNQMTTKINMEEPKLVPALGESWGHASTNRVILYSRNGMRHAFLFKSPYLQEKTASYQITASGIGDVATKNGNDRKRLRSNDENE